MAAEIVKKLTIFSAEDNQTAQSKWTAVRSIQVTDEFVGINKETGSFNAAEFRNLAASLEPRITNLRISVVDL